MSRFNFENFLSNYEKAKAQNTPFVVATLAQCSGSAPQELGARIIIGPQGLMSGTIGGGALENDVIQTAKKFLQDKDHSTHFIQRNLQKDLGMACGGVVGILIEIHHPQDPWKIAVFGAGHVAQELIPVLLRMECSLTCIDPRQEWLDKLPEHAQLKKIQTEDMAKVVSELSADTFVSVITMGHKTDFPVISAALKRDKPFPYLGVIGSDTKAKSLRSRLIEAGHTEKEVESFICPIGEDFGNNIPAEIAISIAAQLLKKRDAFFNKKIFL